MRARAGGSVVAISLSTGSRSTFPGTEPAPGCMLARYPWLGFGAELPACFEDQARRKPGSAAAASVSRDVARRIAANPLGGLSAV